jgi:hypothetical protein
MFPSAVRISVGLEKYTRKVSPRATQSADECQRSCRLLAFSVQQQQQQQLRCDVFRHALDFLLIVMTRVS